MVRVIFSLGFTRSSWATALQLNAMLAAVLAIANLDCDEALAATRTYSNPVYDGSMPDPSVIRYRDAYYAFGTTGSERLADGRIFTLLRSTNLVDWQMLGGAMQPPSTNSRAQYW